MSVRLPAAEVGSLKEVDRSVAGLVPLTICDALAEADRARRYRRALRRRPCGSGWNDLAEIAARATRDRAEHSLERVLSQAEDRVVDLGAYLSRIATLVQLSSPVITRLMTSIPELYVAGRTASALAAIVRELVHIVEAGASPTKPLTVYLAAERNEDRLTLALACPEAADAPAPTASAADAFARASGLISLCGGCLVRGVANGMMIFGFEIGLTKVSVKGARPARP